MATDYSQSAYRGVIVLDPRTDADAFLPTASTYTEASPRPGVPEDQNTPRSRMVLEASGSQAAGSEMRIQTIQGGFPGVTGNFSGSFAWKDADDTTWRGWQPPNAITSWEWLWWDPSGAGAANTPSLLRLRNGRVLAAFWGYAAGDFIKVYEISSDGSWANVESINPVAAFPAAAPLGIPWPTMVEVENGRVLCFFWVYDSGTAELQVQMWYSDDSGTTFALGSNYCLDETVSTGDYTAGRLVAAYNAGQVLLLACVVDGTPPLTKGEGMWQYASDDDGCTFTRVYQFDLSSDEVATAPCILPTSDGGFYVGYVDTLDANPYYRRISNAFQPLSNIAETAITYPDNTDVVLAMWTGEDGTWYAASQLTASNYAMVVMMSLDEGVSWIRMETGSGASVGEAAWNPGDGDIRWSQICATEYRGRTIMLAKAVTPNTSADTYSIAALYLGGHTDVSWPLTSLFAPADRSVSWNNTYAGTESPANYTGQWTIGTAGAPTVSTGQEGFDITTTTADTYFASDTFTGDTATDVCFLFDVAVIQGGQIGTHLIGVKLRQANGVDDYEVNIRMSTTAWDLYDVNAAAKVGSTVTVDMAAGVQILVGMGQEGKIATWSRLRGNAGEPDREWTAGPTSAALTSDIATPAATNLWQWGHGAAPSSGTHQSQWMWASRGADETAVASPVPGLAAGQTNPDDLMGRPYSRRPITLPDGIRLSTVDGPTMRAETWNIDTRYLYPVEYLDPRVAPSPRQKWRSTGTASVELVWQLSEEASANSRLLNSTWALVVLGGNTFKVDFEVYDGSSWTALNTAIYPQIGGLDFVRDGSLLRPNPAGSSSSTVYLHAHELAGCIVEIGSGVYRRILDNSEGWWEDGTTTKRPYLLIHPDDFNAAEAASGTLAIGWPDHIIVVHNVGEYRRVKARLLYTSVDGYTEEGIVSFGPVMFFGKDYSRGRVVTTETGTEVVTRRSGARSSRNLSPPRRTVEFAWKEGISETDLDGTAAPGYIQSTSTTTSPVAARNDIGPLVEGIHRMTLGAHVPIVYLPKIPKGTPDKIAIFRRDDFIYGRMVSGVRRESILGDESQNEQVRVGSIVIEEEL